MHSLNRVEAVDPDEVMEIEQHVEQMSGPESSLVLNGKVEVGDSVGIDLNKAPNDFKNHFL